MYKPKGIRNAFISVVLIIATLFTATVFAACDGISDLDSNLSASSVTETLADESAEIPSRAPTPEPTLMHTGKMPYQSPAPTPDVKHTPYPAPIRTAPHNFTDDWISHSDSTHKSTCSTCGESAYG